MHGLYVLFRALIEPGDQVILPDPMWTEIGENIRLAGGEPVPVRLRAENGYQYDPADMRAAITPRTRGIFINTPHNPTGAVACRETLQAIAALADQYNLWIVSDEAYEHVIFDGKQHLSIGSLPAARDRTFTVFSMSKTYAMSGLRIGYIVLPSDKILERVKKLVRCTINGVNSIAQWGATAALNGPQDATRAMASEYQRRRDILVEALSEAPYVTPFKPSGTFYVWCKITPDWVGYQGARDDWSMTNYLIDAAGIGSSPGTAFGAAGKQCIRFAFSCSTAMVQQAASLLPETLKKASA
jgi:aspartate aminotransferase